MCIRSSSVHGFLAEYLKFTAEGRTRPRQLSTCPPHQVPSPYCVLVVQSIGSCLCSESASTVITFLADGNCRRNHPPSSSAVTSNETEASVMRKRSDCLRRGPLERISRSLLSFKFLGVPEIHVLMPVNMSKIIDVPERHEFQNGSKPGLS